MAGVPAIMQAMLDEVTPRLRTGARMLSRTIKLACPEGEVAEVFARHQQAYPDVVMGSYPGFKDGRYATELVLRTRDAGRLNEAASALCQVLESLGLRPGSTGAGAG
jgi:molybdopterin-biosynthesis enzyme MoeA-like protein